jgi:hypothetical protein
VRSEHLDWPWFLTDPASRLQGVVTFNAARDIAACRRLMDLDKVLDPTALADSA